MDMPRRDATTCARADMLRHHRIKNTLCPNLNNLSRGLNLRHGSNSLNSDSVLLI